MIYRVCKFESEYPNYKRAWWYNFCRQCQQEFLKLSNDEMKEFGFNNEYYMRATAKKWGISDTLSGYVTFDSKKHYTMFLLRWE